MIEFYSQIKIVHLSCVLLSGSLFATRGLMMLRGLPLGRHAVLRWLSYVNDSILLTDGLLLMQITRQYPIRNDWMSVKLTLLLIYIGLGVMALRQSQTWRRRLTFFALAILVFATMLSIARSHHPLGWMAGYPLF